MTERKNLNIEEIKRLIPHRYPFLLIDRLEDIKPNIIVAITFFE